MLIFWWYRYIWWYYEYIGVQMDVSWPLDIIPGFSVRWSFLTDRWNDILWVYWLLDVMYLDFMPMSAWWHLAVIWINIYIVWVESWDSDVRSPGVHVLCAALYVFIMYRFITSWVVHDAASTIVISYTYFYNIRSCVISTVVCCHDDSLIMSCIFKPLLDIFIMSDYIVYVGTTIIIHIKAIEEILIMWIHLIKLHTIIQLIWLFQLIYYFY